MATHSLEEQNTAITTATTTTVFTALAGANDEARIKQGMMIVRNKGAVDNVILVDKYVGGTTQYEMSEYTLSAGEEWVNPWDLAIAGTGSIVRVTTSSASAIDVVVGFIKKVA